MAATVQASPGAQPPGDHAEQPTGRAVRPPGRQLRLGHDGQDVRSQGQPAAGRDRQIEEERTIGGERCFLSETEGILGTACMTLTA